MFRSSLFHSIKVEEKKIETNMFYSEMWQLIVISCKALLVVEITSKYLGD